MKKVSSNTLFDMTEDEDYLTFLEGLINKTKTIEVSNEELIFTKLIQGDKKDSVPSVHLKETKTGKMMGIGKGGALTTYKLYKETYDELIDFDSEEFVEKAAEMVSYVKKVTEEEKIDTIKDNIRRNRKLLILTDTYLPKRLLETFDEKIDIGNYIKPKNDFDEFFNVDFVPEEDKTENESFNSDLDDFFS